MITKERRSRLREQWETESGCADEWRAQLTEEEAAMVELWDRIRQDAQDRITRRYWDERRRDA